MTHTVTLTSDELENICYALRIAASRHTVMGCEAQREGGRAGHWALSDKLDVLWTKLQAATP